ncbi:tetratricopeptide repeat protein [Psychroserpens sp. BH13MA-6]
MKNIIAFCCSVVLVTTSFAQNKDKEKTQELSEKAAKTYVYQANELIEGDNFISAEKEYRKAISKAPSVVAGTYNLGNSYYEKGNFDEALYRHMQAAESATSKSEKHQSYHNMGNILMKENLCKEAVEAYKNALRNDPSDDETRYNLVVAQECAKQQEEDKKQEQEEEKKDENKEDENKDKDKKEDEEKKDDPKDQGDQDKKEGDDQKDEDGKPKDEKDQGKGDEKKDDQEQKGKPKPQPGQLSPQQIKNLLEAMNNQEQKVQEKMNAQKQKGPKVKPEKDW